MKITRLHYERLATAIRDFKALYKPTDSDKLKDIDPWKERIRAYQADPKFKDWRTAFIWAIYHAVTTDMTIRDMMREGYRSTDGTKSIPYSDSHIETALKKILHNEVYP